MTSQPVSELPPPRFALLIVFLTVFIDLLGFGIVLPVMPRQAEPYLDELGVSQIMAGGIIGVLFSVFSAYIKHNYFSRNLYQLFQMRNF